MKGTFLNKFVRATVTTMPRISCTIGGSCQRERLLVSVWPWSWMQVEAAINVVKPAMGCLLAMGLATCGSGAALGIGALLLG